MLTARTKRAKAVPEGKPVDQLPEPKGRGVSSTSTLQAVLAGQLAARGRELSEA